LPALPNDEEVMPRTTLKQLTEKMMAYGQRFPEVTVGHPWGETTLQVRGKNFLFLRHEGDELKTHAADPNLDRLSLLSAFRAFTNDKGPIARSKKFEPSLDSPPSAAPS
jgi:hypothetical protein